MSICHNERRTRIAIAVSPDTGNALVELVAVALSSDAQALLQYAEARQALVEIAAPLAAMNIPTALALQERIKQLR